jgi:flavin reductase (DIM6/NTAB) family NADH-FMN oxidoreductase RutF
MDARTYRDLIGHFATGVTVVTTASDGLLHGMTANAVSSVSLDPVLLLVCVARDETCNEQMRAAGRFAVNVLSADQLALSDVFAQKAEPEQGSLRGAAFHIGPHGSPILEGCLAAIECAVEERLRGGDHDLFLGRVLGGTKAGGGAAPLLFYRGAYRRLAD